MAAAAQAPTGLSALTARPADWARQGVETVATAVKIISDLTAQELALGIGMVRERVTLRPAPAVAELAGRTITALIAAEKILLDLAVGETALITDGLKEVLPIRPSVAALADLIPRGVETIAEVQTQFLDTAVQEIQGLVESYTEDQPLMAVTRLGNLTRTELECLIDIQKKLLDQFAEQVTLATEGGEKASKGAGKDRSQVAIRMTRDSIEKLIDTQKRLLHLAIEQLEAGMPHERPQKRTSFAELTQKSVHNITAAQKSLLDLAVRPIRGEAETETEAEAEVPGAEDEPRKAPRRPRRKK